MASASGSPRAVGGGRLGKGAAVTGAPLKAVRAGVTAAGKDLAVLDCQQ